MGSATDRQSTPPKAALYSVYVDHGSEEKRQLIAVTASSRGGGHGPLWELAGPPWSCGEGPAADPSERVAALGKDGRMPVHCQAVP